MNNGYWAMPMMLLVTWALAVSTASAQGLSVTSTPQGRFLVHGSHTLLELSSPWVTTSDYQQIYRFPGAPYTGNAPVTTVDQTENGRWTETITSTLDSMTIRYEFELATNPKMAHLEWVWRLEPQSWNGIIAKAVGGKTKKPAGPQPLEGMNIGDLKQMEFVLPDADLSITCRSADGAWAFQDARAAEWARCYRLQYIRDAQVNGQRSGWFEVTIGVKNATSPLDPLTRGESVKVQGMQFEQGPVPNPINQTIIKRDAAS